MTTLRISNKATTISGERPIINEARFIYNYFLPDEAGNDMSDNAGGFLMSRESAEAFEQAKSFNVTSPRLVAVSVTPGRILGNTVDTNIEELLQGGNLDDYLMKDIDLFQKF